MEIGRLNQLALIGQIQLIMFTYILELKLPIFKRFRSLKHHLTLEIQYQNYTPHTSYLASQAWISNFHSLVEYLEFQYFSISSAVLPGILPAIKDHLLQASSVNQYNQRLKKIMHVSEKRRIEMVYLSPTRLNMITISVSSSSEN